MVNFDFQNTARIVFGTLTAEKLSSLLKENNATSVMLVSDGIPHIIGFYKTIEEACRLAGASLIDIEDVKSNPKIELVRDIARIGKEKKVDFLIGAGGGSSIDTAKAASIAIPYDGDPWDFFTGSSFPKCALPIGAITTLPASGSETSNAAILSNGVAKVGFEDNMILPRFAIMDPAFTLGLPAFQTSAGSADIFSHLFERYLTTVENVDATDYMIEGALKAVMVNARRLVNNPKDLNARGEMQLLACLAHNGMLELGRTPDWASHRIEHELSGTYGITHGEGMAVVMVAYTRYMAEKLPHKFAQLASRVFGIDPYNHSEKEMALILADKMQAFFKELHLRTTLTELGIDDSKFEEMAMRATGGDKNTIGHFIPLHAKEMVEVLKLAL